MSILGNIRWRGCCCCFSLQSGLIFSIVILTTIFIAMLSLFSYAVTNLFGWEKDNLCPLILAYGHAILIILGIFISFAGAYQENHGLAQRAAEIFFIAWVVYVVASILSYIPKVHKMGCVVYRCPDLVWLQDSYWRHDKFDEKEYVNLTDLRDTRRKFCKCTPASNQLYQYDGQNYPEEDYPEQDYADSYQDQIYLDSRSQDQIYQDSRSQDQIYQDSKSQDQIYQDSRSQDQIYQDSRSQDKINPDLKSQDHIYQDSRSQDKINPDLRSQDHIYQDPLYEDQSYHVQYEEDPLHKALEGAVLGKRVNFSIPKLVTPFRPEASTWFHWRTYPTLRKTPKEEATTWFQWKPWRTTKSPRLKTTKEQGSKIKVIRPRTSPEEQRKQAVKKPELDQGPKPETTPGTKTEPPKTKPPNQEQDKEQGTNSTNTGKEPQNDSKKESKEGTKKDLVKFKIRHSLFGMIISGICNFLYAAFLMHIACLHVAYSNDIKRRLIGAKCFCHADLSEIPPI